jgi:hypothetical protein
MSTVGITTLYAMKTLMLGGGQFLSFFQQKCFFFPNQVPQNPSVSMSPHQQQMMMQQRMQMSNMAVMRPNQMGEMGPGVPGPGGMMGPMNGPGGMRPQMNPQMMMQMQQQMQMQQNRPPPPEYGKMMPQVNHRQTS